MEQINLVEKRKKIVIVEDEPDTAEMLAEMMNLQGYQVFKSYGGTRAIALIAEKAPDAVILDIMMPDLSGLDVLRFMHRDPRLSCIPVVIVSAKGLPSDIQLGLESGAASYLTKPVAFQDLSLAIEKATQPAGD
jgi:DNA-binding response OmpR family regulator